MATNAELDRWIAEHVMGWRLSPGGLSWVCNGNPVRPAYTWSPTTSIVDTFKALDKWRVLFPHGAVRIRKDPGADWVVRMYPDPGHSDVAEATDASLSMAISKAMQHDGENP
jgi:hypothetical protein